MSNNRFNRDGYLPVSPMRFIDPLSIFDDFRGGITDRFFENAFPGFAAKSDLYRKDGKIFVEAELPGVNPDDVDLHVYSDRITLSAEKKSETNDNSNDKSYFRTERSWGKIERVLSFPVEADPETAKASFKNGVLIVEVAEKSQDKAHKKLTISQD